MAFNAEIQPVKTQEQLGAFTGYIRRPLPSNAGMTAQIFGENGEDADTILVLSLSKYQDSQVFVNMYLVKDSNGQIMKENGKYPLICSFLGFIRRSNPKKDGMIAQIFAPNGENSDEVSKLSKSEYLDCLVFVDVRGSLAAKDKTDIETLNIQDIDENYSKRLTKNEKEDIAKLDKKYKKLNEELELDFLSRIEVLTNLGTEEDFKKWLLKNQTCSYAQDKSCNESGEIVQIAGLVQPFNYLPSCTLHNHEMATAQHFEDNHFLYEVRHLYLLKKWALDILHDKFTDNGYSTPNPNKIIEWANTNGVAKYLPSKYKIVI